MFVQSIIIVVFACLTRARFGVGRVNTCPFVGVEGGLVVYATLEAFTCIHWWQKFVYIILYIIIIAP